MLLWLVQCEHTYLLDETSHQMTTCLPHLSDRHNDLDKSMLAPSHPFTAHPCVAAL